jgi:hypothetical protein
MTESARQCLVGLRDFGTLQWYAVPLLAMLFYVYVVEIREARKSGNWDPIIAGAALFSADIVNETLNGWLFALSGYSALWLAPGPTAFRALVGLNAEIMFMFALAGIIYYKSLDDDPAKKVLGLPNRWFWALLYSGVSVFVELFLNKGKLLIWDYRWWNANVVGVLLIFTFGYLWFYLAAKFAIERKTLKAKVLVPVALVGFAAVMNVIGMGAMGLRY